jgi:HEAT repeat protein
MHAMRPRFKLQTVLILLMFVALGLWAWPVWIRYRTEQVFRSFGVIYDRDTSGHQRAAQAILSIGGGRACVPPLIEALRSRDSGRQFAAAMAISGIGPDAYEAVPALTELLDVPDLYARQVAPGALAAIGPSARPALPALSRSLRDEEWLVRTKAAEAIFIIDSKIVSKEAIPTLREILNHSDAMARAEASRILERIERSGGRSQGAP